MQILDLPPELLAQIPQHLATIEDHLSLSSTCRAFYLACQDTDPNALLRLCAAQSRIFFRPDPHFLILACARELGTWAVHNEVQRLELRDALRGGVEGLFDLCVAVCGLRLADIRRMYEARFRVINPFSDAIDQMAGTQWYTEAENFWSGGVSEPATLQTVPDRAAMQILIYSELFGGDMRAALHPEDKLPILGHEMRLEFVKYCIPDWICYPGYPGVEVLNVGPYSKDSTGERDVAESLPSDQIALQHILHCRRWVKRWEAVMREIGPRFSGNDLKGQDEDEMDQVTDSNEAMAWGPHWKQRLWLSALMMQGIEGIEVMLKVSGGKNIEDVGDGKWKDKLKKVRSKVEALEEAPQVYKYGRLELEASDAPNMFAEVHMCMRSYWPGTGAW